MRFRTLPARLSWLPSSPQLPKVYVPAFLLRAPPEILIRYIYHMDLAPKPS